MLTATAASADAISYLGLGHVFPANMTGNTVLLAVGLAGRDYTAAIRSAVALAGFVAGAAAAGRARTGPTWSRRLVVTLLGELALLVAVAVWWARLPDAPHHGARYGLIVRFSLAMGTQSAAVTQLDAGVST
ncbi:MAG: YoaK family protein, partial [Mycobacteriales bacterium]